MSFRGDVRDVVDPMFIRFREELMGSGVSFGRLSENSLPTTVVYTNTVQTIIDGAGYIKGITTQSGGVTVGVNQKTLRFINATITSAGDITTIIIPSGGSSFTGSGLANPMTTLGDMITGGALGAAQRLPIGASGQVLSVFSGIPSWQTLAQYTDPLTTDGDILYRLSGATTRLPVGNNGEILTIVGNLPVWQSPASGTGSNILVETYTGATSVTANRIELPDGNLAASGARAYIQINNGVPIDGSPLTAHAKNDEFAGTALDAKWTSPATSTRPVTITFDNSWIYIEPATTGTASTGSRGGFGIRQAAPSGSFTVSARIINGTGGTNGITTDDALVGIFVARATTPSGSHMFGYRETIPRIAEVLDFNYSNTTDWGAFLGYNPRTNSDQQQYGSWYRVAWDASASSLSFYYSTNGVYWKLLATRTSQSQPEYIGIGIWANTANIIANHSVACDWFRVTEP